MRNKNPNKNQGGRDEQPMCSGVCFTRVSNVVTGILHEDHVTWKSWLTPAVVKEYK
jgi:hypothetical protein